MKKTVILPFVMSIAIVGCGGGSGSGNGASDNGSQPDYDYEHPQDSAITLVNTTMFSGEYYSKDSVGYSSIDKEGNAEPVVNVFHDLESKSITEIMEICDLDSAELTIGSVTDLGNGYKYAKVNHIAHVYYDHYAGEEHKCTWHNEDVSYIVNPENGNLYRFDDMHETGERYHYIHGIIPANSTKNATNNPIFTISSYNHLVETHHVMELITENIEGLKGAVKEVYSNDVYDRVADKSIGEYINYITVSADHLAFDRDYDSSVVFNKDTGIYLDLDNDQTTFSSSKSFIHENGSDLFVELYVDTQGLSSITTYGENGVTTDILDIQDVKYRSVPKYIKPVAVSLNESNKLFIEHDCSLLTLEDYSGTYFESNLVTKSNDGYSIHMNQNDDYAFCSGANIAITINKKNGEVISYDYPSTLQSNEYRSMSISKDGLVAYKVAGSSIHENVYVTHDLLTHEVSELLVISDDNRKIFDLTPVNI